MTVTEINITKPNKYLVERLKYALALAESGELQSVIMLKYHQDGKVSTLWSMTQDTEVIRFLGELEYTKISIIEWIRSWDGSAINEEK